MLRKSRIILALIFFISITLLFFDFTGTIHSYLGWMARVQFIPAVLSLNFIVVAVLLLLTILFGRVYCSVICPLGVMQDIISYFSGKMRKNKNRFSFSPSRKILRYSFLILFIISLVAGINSIFVLLAPYSSYGRIVSTLISPFYYWGNNILAFFAERLDSYAFYSVDVWLKGISTFIITLLTFILIFVLAWRNGRTYCNTICPVGTVLGFFSKFSIFRPVIDTTKCNGCGLCSRNCKAACIDSKSHAIDYSRCVMCMDCIENCKRNAISYKRRTGNEMVSCKDDKKEISRRNFLATIATLAAIPAVQAQKKIDGGLAVIEAKKVPDRTTHILPPGAISKRHFAQHCTACQLCVSVCPNQVLRPSQKLDSLMQPEASYERGYCRPECVKCSEVCPSGAIKPINIVDKTAIQIGHAVWIKENCVVLTDGVSCGNCARHCPTGAIQMVYSNPDDENSAKIPVINTERCIGCGACENLCPSRPYSAIYVEGHISHRII